MQLNIRYLYLLYTLHITRSTSYIMITTLLWAIHLQLAAALNGNGRQAFTTYDGWKAFEVVTQGDKLGGFELPGNLDGIGVSLFVAACPSVLASIMVSNLIHFLVQIQAYLMEGGDDIRVLVNHESVSTAVNTPIIDSPFFTSHVLSCI